MIDGQEQKNRNTLSKQEVSKTRKTKMSKRFDIFRFLELFNICQKRLRICSALLLKCKTLRTVHPAWCHVTRRPSRTMSRHAPPIVWSKIIFVQCCNKQSVSCLLLMKGNNRGVYGGGGFTSDLISHHQIQGTNRDLNQQSVGHCCLKSLCCNTLERQQQTTICTCTNLHDNWWH